MNENSFGNLLREYMKEYAISQLKLAEDTGYDHSFISRLWSGQRKPTRENVERIIPALRLPPPKRDALQAAAGLLPDTLDHLIALPELAQLNSVWPQLPPEIQGELTTLLRVALRSTRPFSTQS
jgi:transcriptional regulator with XRE-family HTH domain